ncbi:MAG: hypothetical protein PHU12_00590 [Candidatus Aenigmarchaeota archaeon]|nr:hypothetical protein [Candidatus Aenigmarchaeota archaeon]
MKINSLDANLINNSIIMSTSKLEMQPEVILEDEEMICTGCEIDPSFDIAEFSQDFIWHPSKKY